MQVDPTLMNVGDGGTVSREISAPNKVSTTMVGNPPQTLPPEFRGDVTLSHQNKTIAKNTKTLKTSLDTYNHSTGLSSLQQLNTAPVACSALIVTDKRANIPKTKADNTGVFSTPQWSSGVNVDREESLSPCRSNMTSSNQSKTQMQSQSAPPGFHCSTIFKPTQSVAFLPSANFSSLCKITLPPALGQIAALREATASQFQKNIKPQSSPGTPLIRTYPYPFTAGQGSSTEKKLDACTSKQKSSHLSNKNSKSVEHRSLASVVASPAIALPVQHPSLTSLAPTHYSMSPTAAICCGSALANLASQGRLLNPIDKSNSIDLTTITLMNSAIPTTSDDQGTSCSNESRDVPLDLSAKSKRPKCIKDPPGSPAITFKDESNQDNFVNSKRTFSSFSSAVQYPLLPHTHRNGSHQKELRAPQNPHILDAKPCWSKGSSQDPIKNIPGTYVGVASPILASTLRGQDGKGTFADEFQSFAKQEFISIIDQGEHMASEEHKPSSLKSDQLTLRVKHVKNTSTKIPAKCLSKANLTATQSSSANKQIPKSGSGKMAVSYPPTVSPAWQQPEDFSQQPLTLPRRNTSASPKNKNPLAIDESKNADYSLPSSDDKWEQIQSPLSNLASIVKQQSLDTAMFASEGNAKPTPATSRKNNSLEKFKSNQNIQCKDNLESPPVWSVEKWPSTSQRDDVPHLTKAVKRLEKLTNATEPTDDPREIQSSQEEHTTPLTQQTSLNPTVKSKVIENNSSTAGNRMESKLAQVLEGEILNKDRGLTDTSTPGKLEGSVAANVAGYCEEGGNSIEKKSNGVNDISPNKTKATPVKQKKQSPKKLMKLNSPVVSSKKSTGNAKKQIHSDATPIKVSPSKKQSLLANQLSQPGDDLPLVKSSHKRFEQPCLKADGNYRLQKTKIRANKEVEATELCVPRLRRGRRRADESRLDLWGFATPSPPPTPPPPASPPPTPPQVARRPRGRPRSTPLPERGAQGKGKNTSANTEGPVNRKRQRCKNKRYQTGDYITDKDKLDDGEQRHESDLHSQDHGNTADLQKCLNPPSSSREPRRLSLTRSVCYQEREDSPECIDKPSGKRKFKSKHLCPTDEHKINPKRSLGKRSGSRVADEDCSEAKKAISPPVSPKSLPSPPSNINGSTGKHSASETPPKRAIPPEVRRLIVNKNAGETLLQRAARLGYQDVVQYCLEKDQREVNRQDNAGYTALHEASSRGWVQIVQMLLKNGADVNCSAQDGTRPIHDAVASDNLAIVWLLLNHGADPTLATYSGQTPVKLAHSSSMKTFLSEYFTDLQGRSEHDPGLHWDFYSSTLFETEQEPCWDFLLSEQNQDLEKDTGVSTEKDHDKDCLVFEFSSEPLLQCYHIQVSLTQGFCNWFLLTDVLKRVKMSARIFRARFPHLEVVSLPHAELMKQVSVSQVSPALASPHKGQNKDTDDEEEEEDEEGHVDLVRCVPELQKLLGSSIYILQDNEEEEEPNEDKFTNTGKLRSR